MSKVKTDLLDALPENLRKMVIKEASELLKEEGWIAPKGMEATDEDIKKWSESNKRQNQSK